MAIDGEIMETVRDFIFWGSKIIADGHCSHEIKSCLLFGRKVMTNLDSILKNRDMGGGVKMAEEKDGETTFSPTNSWKEQLNGEQSLQNNF